MRTLHADLITAQQSGAADPYIYLTINSVDYSSRLIKLEHIEEPYRDSAVIVLANSDLHFSSNDKRGLPVLIGYGYVDGNSVNRYCGDGAGSEAMPTLWVKTQSMVSMEGELVCILECEGAWIKLRENTFISVATGEEAPYFDIPFTSTDTVFELTEKILEEVNYTTAGAKFSLNASPAVDDDILNTFLPFFTINPLTFENAAAIVYNLVQMTKCFLREVEGGAFEYVYPQSTDSILITYYSNEAPFFKEYVEKKNQLIPNHIVVFANRDPDDATGWDTPEYPLVTGHARDPDQFDAVGVYDGTYQEVIEYVLAPRIDNQDDADNRAAAILTRYRSEILSARLVLPFHDCQVELYDRISVKDRRGSI